ncbi:MAG: cytochrome c3 family protein [Pseudomonadota bacterium]
MKKSKALLVVLVIVGVSFGLVSLGLSVVDKGPAKISIGVASEKYHPAQFPHDKHQDEILKGDCKKCHHDYKEGEKAPKCTDCHTKAGDPKGKGKKAQDVFHKTCRDCHREQKKAGNEKAKVTCTVCHKKKSDK